MKVFLATKIFDPANLPNDKEVVTSYVLEEVRVLGEHFSEVLEKQGGNTTELEWEWLKLKLDLDRNHWSENFHTLWKRVLKEKTHK